MVRSYPIEDNRICRHCKNRGAMENGYCIQCFVEDHVTIKKKSRWERFVEFLDAFLS